MLASADQVPHGQLEAACKAPNQQLLCTVSRAELAAGCRPQAIQRLPEPGEAARDANASPHQLLLCCLPPCVRWGATGTGGCSDRHVVSVPAREGTAKLSRSECRMYCHGNALRGPSRAAPPPCNLQGDLQDPLGSLYFFRRRNTHQLLLCQHQSSPHVYQQQLISPKQHSLWALHKGLCNSCPRAYLVSASKGGPPTSSSYASTPAPHTSAGSP